MFCIQLTVKTPKGETKTIQARHTDGSLRVWPRKDKAKGFAQLRGIVKGAEWNGVTILDTPKVINLATLELNARARARKSS